MTQYAIFLHYEDASSEAFGPFNSFAAANEAFGKLRDGISSDTIMALEPLQKLTPAALEGIIALHPEGLAGDWDPEDDGSIIAERVEVDADGKY